MVTTSNKTITQVHHNDPEWGSNLVTIWQNGKSIAILNEDLDTFIECVQEQRDELRRRIAALRSRAHRPGQQDTPTLRNDFEPITRAEGMSND